MRRLVPFDGGGVGSGVDYHQVGHFMFVCVCDVERERERERNITWCDRGVRIALVGKMGYL